LNRRVSESDMETSAASPSAGLCNMVNHEVRNAFLLH
jgi:hypothetical protein